MVSYIRSDKFGILSMVLVMSVISAISAISVSVAIGSVNGTVTFPVDTNSRISCAENLVCVEASPSVGSVVGPVTVPVGSVSGVPYGGPIG